MLAKIRDRNIITIPSEIIKAAGIKPGDDVEIIMETDGSIRLVPVLVIPKEQAWFYSEHWQKGMAEASKEVSSGKIITYDSPEDFFTLVENEME
ncbi:MAG: AbrB/MazE/SpoVT family DNA-binding domain-containing protein [Syntrophomonadaceae bacterium]|nr:AbrB/MazE/SpoVT family DNA-binding domain-containing protein [Syntrophomonadaceae bacterium]